MTQTTLIDWQPGQTARHNGAVVTLITFPACAGYSPARLAHSCPLGVDCRRWDVTGGTAAFAWECELLPTLTEGQSASRPVGDGRHVRITCVRPGHAYHVDVVTVGPIAGVLNSADRAWSGTSETEAREYGNLLVAGLREQNNTDDMPAKATVAARPVAKGHQLDMSQSQAAAILMAGIGGTIDRGAPAVDGLPTGRLTDTQIRAAAARGWVEPIVAPGARRSIIGCQPTISGWQRARKLNQTTNATTAA